MKTLTTLLIAIALISCEKERIEPQTPAKFTATLTVDNQTGHSVTFKTATGQDDGQQYESTTGNDATFPTGISTQTFTSNANFDNIYFIWWIEDRSMQVWKIRDSVLAFWGYGYTHTMQPDNNNITLTVINVTK